MIVLSENFRALFYAPFYACFALGAFRAEGVEVVLRHSPSPAHANADLRTGAADVMWGGPLRVALTHQDDPSSDLVCFCDAVQRDPFYIIGNLPITKMTPHRLSGFRFAPTSEVPTPWLCLQDDLRQLGVSVSSIKLQPAKSMAENATLLQEGLIDAFQVFEPGAETMFHEGAGYLWYAAATRGLTAYTTLITRRPTMTEKHDELLAMVRAMSTALRWIEDTPGREIARALASYFPLVPEVIFAGAMNRYRMLKVYAIDPVIPPEGFDRLVNAMVSGGALRAPMAFEACVDNRLANEVAASLPPWQGVRKQTELGSDGMERLPIRPPVNPRKKKKAAAKHNHDHETAP